MYRVVSAALTLSILLCAAPAVAATLQGSLPSDETWTGTVDLLGDVTIPSGRTLTISAGTVVTFPSNDSMGAGDSTTKTELIVDGGGTLRVQGSAGQPAVFRARSGTTAGTWHAIRLRAASTASIQHATIEHASIGLQSDISVTLNGLLLRTNTIGVELNAGSSTLTASTFTGNRRPFELNGGTATVSRNLFYGNCVGTSSSSGYAVYFYGAAGSTFDHNTVADNPSCYYGVYGQNVAVTNNIVSRNGYYGLYRVSSSMTATHNDVWGHSSNFNTSLLEGTGSLSANPLFVGGTNYRVTSQSPARKADSSGGDLGALPYVSDATALLMGTLYTDTTWVTGQTYTLDGDLIVGPGVTLTVQPGAIVKAKDTDAMQAGDDTARPELIVRGTLDVQEGAAETTFGSAATTPVAGSWFGIRFETGSSGAIRKARIEHATKAVEANAGITLDKLTLRSNTIGVELNAGSSTLTASTFTGNRRPFELNGGTASVSRNVFYGNCVGTSSSSGYAAYFYGAAGSTFDHNTVADNPSCYYAVYGQNVAVTNNIVSKNGYYGLYRVSSSMTATHNDVWGHPSNFSTSLLEGTGTISANPLFVGGGNYRITSHSPARKADSSGGDLGALPYVSDATALLMGTLYTDTTWVSGQTYTLDGDLVVGPGVTLTVQPGAIVTAKTTDAMQAGDDTARPELIVRGTLDVQEGATETTFTSASSSPVAGSWFGIRFETGSSGAIRKARIEHATKAVEANAGITLDKLTLRTNTIGVELNAGSSTLTASTFTSNRRPFELNGGTASVSRNVFYGNCVGTSSSSGYAAYFYGAAGSTFDHNTVADNPSCYYAVYGQNVAVTNNIVASNGYYGLYRVSSSMTATHNDVWGHSSNFSTSLLEGTGTLSANPLFVGGGNYRITSHSPARKADSSGGDLGALPYITDATALLMGTLYTDTTWLSGQTYTLDGDLVVGAGVTLTVQPGAIVKAKTTDAMQAGDDTSRIELIVRGTLDVQEGPTETSFGSAATTPAAGNWTGIRFETGSSGAIRMARIEHASKAVEANAGITLDKLTLRSNTIGVELNAGSSTLSASTFTGNRRPFELNGGTASVSRNLFYGNCVGTSSSSGYAAYFYGAAGSTFDHNTVADNPSCYYAVYGQNVAVTNNIVASNGYYGLYRVSSSMTASYNDVWGHSSNFSTSLLEGTGTLSANPLFVGGGDYRLQASSPARNKDSAGGDLGAFPYSTGAVATVVVSPSTATVVAGGTTSFSAQAYDANNQPVPNQTYTWTSTAGAISSAGVLTATCTPGSYTGAIRAAVGNISGTASVTVTPGALAAMSLSPANFSLEVGKTRTWTASGTDSCGNAVPVAPVWSVDAAAGTINQSGELTAGCTPGSFIDAIVATQNGVTGKASVTLTLGTLDTVVVSPATATLGAGATQQFSATGADSCGNPISITPSWSVNNGGGSITSSGLFTASGAPGTYTDTVRATANGKSSTATVTVTGGALAQIVVSPANGSYTPRAAQTFTAVGKDASGNDVPITPVWSTSVGNIDPVTGAWLAGTTAGTFPGAIVATVNGVSGSTGVTIVPGPVAQVTVNPPSVEIAPNGTTRFTAIARDGHGNVSAAPITWSASASAGTIDPTGSFTAGSSVGSYSNAVTATAESVSGHATVVIKSGALASLTISPVLANVPVGGAAAFKAEGRDGAGNLMTITPTWSVLAGGGTINAAGIFTAGKVAGSFVDTVQVSASGLTATATVNVGPGPAATVTVFPESPALEPGQPLTFAAAATDAFGNNVASATFTWSAKPEAGTIDSAGLFTAGEEPGTYAEAVTASSGNARGSTSVTINGTPSGDTDAGIPGGTDGGGVEQQCQCAEGETCVDGVCTAPGTPIAGETGCGCSTGGAEVGGALFALLALAFAGRRRVRA